MLPEELSTLKQKLIEYATLVENMMDKAVNGLLSKQKEKLSEIIKKDELKANEFEIEIENLCTSIIARYNPLAVDLRTVLMVLKIMTSLRKLE